MSFREVLSVQMCIRDRGKVVIGIAERAKKQAKSVIAVVGGADDDEIGKAYDMGVTAVFPINRLPQDCLLYTSRCV